jgi:hypothetical protein
LNGGEEGAEGSLDKSTEDEYQVFEKMIKLSANSEVLKEALEQLSSANGKTSVEVGDFLNKLTSQIHDVNVRVGSNPGFVGSQHDSLWNGITRVQENLDSQEAIYNKRLNLLAPSGVDIQVKEAIALTKAAMDRDNLLRDQNQLRMEQQIKALQVQAQAPSALHATVSALQQEVRLLRQDLLIQKQDMIQLSSQNSMPTDFGSDWKLVFDFFVRNTTPSSPPIVGGLLEESVRVNSSDIKRLTADLSKASTPGRGTAASLTSSLSGAGLGVAPAGPLSTIEAQILDLKARMSSKAVTIGKVTFPTLKGTCSWATANLPSSPDQANLCTDVVVLLHSIGKEFATVDQTREEMFQNKRAGVSTMALTVSSSFQTVLPQILGKNRHSTGQDSGLVLPCASKYADWFDNSNGIPTGIKQQIVEGLDTQMAVYDEAIRVLEYTHPEGAAVATKMLQRSFDCAIIVLNLVDTMWSEYLGRSGEVGKEEAWIVISAVIRQFFREFRGVRRPGAAIIPGSANSIGATWWYVLQTHRLMDEFTAAGIRRHPSIIPVFTAHLDRNRVTLTTHASLAEKVKRMEAAVSAVTASVNKLNGARGNPGGDKGKGPNNL